MSDSIDEIRRFLTSRSVVAALNASRGDDHWYHSFDEFILAHGERFAPSPLPSEFRRGRPDQSFRNATELVMRDVSMFTYVEGYVLSSSPVMHAWCLDKDGTVIDPTWEDIKVRGYFGVRFPIRLLYASMAVSDAYGIFHVNSVTEDCPILRREYTPESAMISYSEALIERRDQAVFKRAVTRDRNRFSLGWNG
jgi:hypothetical protein